MKVRAALTEDNWELYDTRNDFSLANDVAAKNAAKLKELQDLFMKEAVEYHVLPIDDRIMERINAAMVGRPDVMGSRTSLTLHEGMMGMSENVFLNMKNRSFTITADVESPAGGANGVILAQGGRFGGWSLYAEGRQADLRLQLPGPPAVHGDRVAAASSGQVDDPLRVRVRRRGSRQGRPRDDLRERQEGGRGADRSHPAGIFSADETADVGMDDATPVSEDYKSSDSKFTGKIVKVTVDVKERGAGAQAEAAKAKAETAKKIETAK